MTIATLEQFKSYARELSSDLDAAFTLALESASAEVRNYLGFDPEETSGGPEPDQVIACCVLAAIHADASDPALNDFRRTAALNLLFPYRLSSGIG